MDQEVKISELPNLTNLNAADLLAIVQSGTTGQAQLNTLANFVLGNISVTENADPESILIRIPTARIQIVGAHLKQTFASQTARASSYAFPQPFADDKYIAVPGSAAGPDGLGTRLTARFPGYFQFRQTVPTAHTGDVFSVWLAVGKY